MQKVAMKNVCLSHVTYNAHTIKHIIVLIVLVFWQNYTHRKSIK